jgi:hypothetical protein
MEWWILPIFASNPTKRAQGQTKPLSALIEWIYHLSSRRELDYSSSTTAWEVHFVMINLCPTIMLGEPSMLSLQSSLTYYREGLSGLCLKSLLVYIIQGLSSSILKSLVVDHQHNHTPKLCMHAYKLHLLFWIIYHLLSIKLNTKYECQVCLTCK